MNENFQTFQGNSSCVFLFYRKKKKKSFSFQRKPSLKPLESLQKIKIKIKTQRERIQIKTSLSKNKWKKNFSFFSGRIEEDEDRWKSLGSFASKLSQGSRGSSTPRLPGLDANRATLDCDTFLANARGGDATGIVETWSRLVSLVHFLRFDTILLLFSGVE